MAFSLLGHCRLFIFADSERVISTLYSCFIDLLCLYCPVQKLFHFVHLAGISALGAFRGCFYGYYPIIV